MNSGYLTRTDSSDATGLLRRDFLGVAAVAIGGAVLGGSTALAALQNATTSVAPKPDAKPGFKISLAQWSLHRALNAKQLSHLDFIIAARKEYGIEAVEYVNSFFKDKATDRGFLAEMKKRCDDAGVRSLLIMCDGEGALGDADGAMRMKAVENHHRWADAARELGCHSIRVNAQSSGAFDEQMKLAADGLRKLTEYCASRDLNCIVENHGGLSSNGGWLSGVMKKVDHPRCGTLPDFGNFNLGEGKTYDRYQGVGELMPFAKAVSAKSHDFDADGNEIHTDYRRMMKLVLEAGYCGYVGIEYEGEKAPEPEGVRLTKRLLERVRAELCS